MMTEAELRMLLENPEGRRIEFKTAANSFEFEELCKYCVALANEGGGKVVFGVSDKRPREIVGTKAFSEPGRTEAALYEQLHKRIALEEYSFAGKRILVAQAPAREPGEAWNYKGTYWMREGDSLVPMTDSQLRRIHEEAGPDFSAEICKNATMADLDPEAIETLRRMWQRKSPGQDIANRPVEQLLGDAELLVNGELNYAALILLGTHQALGRLLGQAEIIFEYRSSEEPGPAAARHEFRKGFLPVLDEIWQLVNLRNDMQHFQQGLFVWDVPTFNEKAVREAVLNAVSHRDYRSQSSVFVRQFPRRIEIVSPGGLPQGITLENLLWRQHPRNRRLAEVLAKCGLVERAGQGMDMIYRQCIRNSKPLPDFTHTDEWYFYLTLHGEIQDPEFLRFLEEIGQERTSSFCTADFILIDLIHRAQKVSPELQGRVQMLIEQGVIERVGQGRGAKLLLSRRFYRHLGKAGVYTRRKGLDREENKALLFSHIKSCEAGGCPVAELQQVLPSRSRAQIKRLLDELRVEGKVKLVGSRRGARWTLVK